MRDGAARWSLLCRWATLDGRCPVTISLRVDGRSAGSGRLTLRPRRRATLRATLNATGRRLARRGGEFEAVLMVRTDRGGGFEQGHPRRWTARLAGGG